MSTPRILPFAADSNGSTPAMDRYQHAYRVAKIVTNFAETVLNAGIFVAGLVFVGAVIAFQSVPTERSDFPVISVSLVAGAVLVILAARLWAMIFRVQGQLLQIATDSAVHSSPWLTQVQRARIMALPNRPADAVKEQKTAA